MGFIGTVWIDHTKNFTKGHGRNLTGIEGVMLTFGVWVKDLCESRMKSWLHFPMKNYESD